MQREVDKRINLMLDSAEAKQSCLAAKNRNDMRALRRRVSLGILCSPERGIFVRRHSWAKLTPAEKNTWIVRALAEMHPRWTFCLYSAALLHGLCVSYPLLDRVYVITPRSGHARRDIRISRCQRESFDADEANGVRVTSLMDTLVDCLLDAGFSEGLVIADSFLRSYGCSKKRLMHEVAIRAKGRKGASCARRTAFYADGLSESGGESLARAVMIEEGFEIPVLQAKLPHPIDCNKEFRLDYLWKLPDGGFVAGEFDGHAKLQDPRMLAGVTSMEALRRERQREALITVYGIRVMRFTFEDVRARKPLIALLERYGIPRKERGR